MKDNTKRLAALALSIALMFVATFGAAVMATPARSGPVGQFFLMDAASDGVNATVSLVTTLLLAILPLIIIISIFGFLIGYLSSGLFGHLGGRGRGPKY